MHPSGECGLFTVATPELTWNSLVVEKALFTNENERVVNSLPVFSSVPVAADRVPERHDGGPASRPEDRRRVHPSAGHQRGLCQVINVRSSRHSAVCVYRTKNALLHSQVEAEPSWAKRLSAVLGPSRMVISFRARNPVTEYTAICSFVLEVRGKRFLPSPAFETVPF